MTVYVVAQIRIHDRDRYQQYEAGFMAIFDKHEGKLLSIDEAPKQLEGNWHATRTVLISFPSRKAAKAWMQSDEYQEIAKHRHAAAETDSVLVQGLDEMQMQDSWPSLNINSSPTR